MNLPRPPFIAALLLALGCTAAPANDEANLLAKYDFENIPAFVPNWGAGLGSTYKPATGWKEPFTVALDTQDTHAGENSLRLELTEGSDKTKILHSPAIKVEPSDSERTVHLRLFVKAAGLMQDGAGIRILERDENSASIRLLNSKDTLIPLADSKDWVELEAEGVLHSRTASISFMVVVYQSEVPATIWIDDISVELKP
jgi:hypothetical protein